MFGLDDKIASLSDGTTLLVVVAVAIVLGLRHASDPDHLAAVTTLVAGGRDGAPRRAARLGATWGAGHATSLFVFGLPIVLWRAYLPKAVQSGAETLVGLVIVGLAVWLLVRWRRGLFRADARVHEHKHTRTPAQAYAIGLVHGMGGSAGVGLLLLGSIRSHTLAVVALALFATCTALSMAILSTGFGLTLSHGRARASLHRIAPALGLLSLAFGIWYALGAQGVLPYYF
jgi:High-affinity nickel-transport protein